MRGKFECTDRAEQAAGWVCGACPGQLGGGTFSITPANSSTIMAVGWLVLILYLVAINCNSCMSSHAGRGVGGRLATPPLPLSMRCIWPCFRRTCNHHHNQR